jgi:hypothetical protein
MTITLINCRVYLEALGIYMERMGSGELLSEKLSERVIWMSWGYNTPEDTLTISVEDGTEVSSLSEFGEVSQNDSNSF